MNRITKKTLETLADNCNRQIPHIGWKYSIEWAYGRPRLVLEDSRLCCRDVSPRLPSSRLAEWIWAYLAGAAEQRDHANAINHALVDAANEAKALNV